MQFDAGKKRLKGVLRLKLFPTNPLRDDILVFFDAGSPERRPPQKKSLLPLLSLFVGGLGLAALIACAKFGSGALLGRPLTTFFFLLNIPLSMGLLDWSLSSLSKKRRPFFLLAVALSFSLGLSNIFLEKQLLLAEWAFSQLSGKKTSLICREKNFTSAAKKPYQTKVRKNSHEKAQTLILTELGAARIDKCKFFPSDVFSEGEDEFSSPKEERDSR